jgi:prepilin-type N-terminal cleavage/methylation domain-containing protein
MNRIRNGQRGFTLMELMVVIVIVAILAAVAVPLYINYVKDARRTEAKGAIGAVITAEQTYFQLHPTVGYIDADLTSGLDPKGNLNCDLTDAKNNWVVVVSDPSTTGFKVTATGKADANGLVVTMTYDRSTGAAWVDQ